MAVHQICCNPGQNYLRKCFINAYYLNTTKLFPNQRLCVKKTPSPVQSCFLQTLRDPVFFWRPNNTASRGRGEGRNWSTTKSRNNQGPKFRLPGPQCDQNFSSGDQNFVVGRQLATGKAGCHCRLSRSEKMIKNWNLEAICQQVSYFSSCRYFFNLKVKRIFL